MSNQETMDIPITSNGQLKPEAGMLILGYMIHPNCERSANQFAQIIADETLAKAHDADCRPSQIFAALVDSKLINRLLLTGEVALKVCANYARTGNPDFSKAAHVVSELNSTIKTTDGKPLPTAERRLRDTFTEYQSVMPLWAAASIGYQHEDGRLISGWDALAEMHVRYEFLGRFLNAARQFELILAKAKPSDLTWSATACATEIWDFDAFPTIALGDEPEAVKAALSSYSSRKKS
ncbi:hypothetical protein [Sulfitobacter sp. W074]|uniref:hypothetical protein n=1 Tax=Sulfitobacter sp. W074 TaxID=2867026 RepID=UPI0021A630A3|nr:hypothetical protein [Sulfitobacter sp. W074]UWR37673.1 hypothetical protein K3762_01105 [Sulfitobacter sp. W074]